MSTFVARLMFLSLFVLGNAHLHDRSGGVLETLFRGMWGCLHELADKKLSLRTSLNATSKKAVLLLSYNTTALQKSHGSSSSCCCVFLHEVKRECQN
mmetsp:Transcript_42381/g.68277  ORF Transcript_42381/g.68277 Transcript_42381/m.68277 type:complete len:97 (-) Transcript_42381:2062-2352(-)